MVFLHGIRNPMTSYITAITNLIPNLQMRERHINDPFTINHTAETANEENMFTGPSETSNLKWHKIPGMTHRLNLWPKCKIMPGLHYKGSATDSESYPNLVSSPKTQIGELVVVVFITPHCSPVLGARSLHPRSDHSWKNMTQITTKP